LKLKVIRQVVKMTNNLSSNEFQLSKKQTVVAQLQQFPIEGKGSQLVTMDGNSMAPGMYLYSFVVDDKIVDIKKMTLTKFELWRKSG
jgi:hypothetical protein